MESRTAKYGRSCLACRKRKVRCDGARPTCRNCVRSKTQQQCSYSERDAVATRLENALRKSERDLNDLLDSLEIASKLEPYDCRGRLTEILENCEHGRHHTPLNTSQEMVHSSTGLTTSPAEQHPVPMTMGATIQDIETESLIQISRFHAQDRDDHSDAHQQHAETTHLEAQGEYHRRWLASQARFNKSFEQQTYAGLAGFGDIEPETATTLIKIYWTWQAPLHNCVYRPTFFRDMVLKGPYFSELLLQVIFAHACRHTRADDPRFAQFQQGEVFLDRARVLLVTELKRDKPTIPTIQALLILGGRQCAVGSSSEGWLYTGMAIRMIQDLGIHLSSSKLLRVMEPDDLEVRKRLFLSAYVWDKSISLTLGRLPSLTSMPFTDHCMYDVSDDCDLWQPFYLGDLEAIYTPTASFSTTTFSHFAKLSTIVNEAFHTVFGRAPEDQSTSTLKDMEEKLRGFFRGLPEALCMNEHHLQATCPPPHICCLNILYHALLILLFRPFFLRRHRSQNIDPGLIAHGVEVCTTEAVAVNRIFQAYGRSYENKNQTYLLSYCVYTAATIEVEQIVSPDHDTAKAAAHRLATTLDMLEAEARQTPGIRRSVDIIRQRLHEQQQLLRSSRNYDERQDLQLDHLTQRNRSNDGAIPTMLHRAMLPPQLVENGVGNEAMPLRDVYTATVKQAGHTREPTLYTTGDAHLSLDWSWGSPDVGGGFVPDMLSWYPT